MYFVIVLVITCQLQVSSEGVDTISPTFSDKALCTSSAPEAALEAALEDAASFLQHITIHSNRVDARLQRANQNISAPKTAHESMQKSTYSRTHVEQIEGSALISTNTSSGLSTAAVCSLTSYILYSFLAILYEVWSHRADRPRQEESTLPYDSSTPAQSPFLLPLSLQSAKPEESLKLGRNPGWDVVKFMLVFFVIAHHFGIFSLHQAIWHGVVAEAEVYKFQDFLHQTVAAGGPFTMCTFAFVSGVFGTYISWSSFSRLFCCTVLANAFYTVLFYAISGLVQGKIDISLASNPGTTWYLIGLFLWRVCITPVFMAADSLGMHRIFFAPFVLGALFCIYSLYAPFMLGVDLVPGSVPRLFRKHWRIDLIFYFWGCIYFAQFYAVGCLLHAKRWTEILEQRLSLAVAACVGAAFVICLISFEWFRMWWDTMCIYETQCALDSHFWHPDSLIVTVLSHGLSLAAAGAYFRTLVQKMILILVLLCLILNAVRWLQKFFPGVIKFLAELGSASLYGWLVTFFIQQQLFDHPEYGIVPLMVVTLSRYPLALVSMLYFFLSLHCLFVFTSRLTRLIWKPILQPLWVLDLFGQFVSFRVELSGSQGESKA